MKIRVATIADMEELVPMYQDLIAWVYPNRKQKDYAAFVGVVKDWFSMSSVKQIFITYNDTDTTGFSVIGYDDGTGTTDIVMNAEIAYVKEEYRKTKAAYLQYMKAYNLAQENRMGLMTTANPTSADISAKRFGADVLFTHIEVSRETMWKSIK